MNNVDPKSIPLLDAEIEKEYNSLVDEKKLFDIHIDELEKEIDLMNYKEGSSILKVKSKIKGIEDKLLKIYDKINYLRNFIKDSNNLPFLINLKSISSQVATKYNNANIKFRVTIQEAQNKLQDEINKNESSTGMTQPMHTQPKQMQMSLSGKGYMSLERLKEVQKEYEAIYQKTVNLARLSEDIKQQTTKQNIKIDEISEDIITVEDATKKANDELNKFKQNQSSRTNTYFWLAFILIGIIVVLVSFIYLKMR